MTRNRPDPDLGVPPEFVGCGPIGFGAVPAAVPPTVAPTSLIPFHVDSIDQLDLVFVGEVRREGDQDVPAAGHGWGQESSRPGARDHLAGVPG